MQTSPLGHSGHFMRYRRALARTLGLVSAASSLFAALGFAPAAQAAASQAAVKGETSVIVVLRKGAGSTTEPSLIKQVEAAGRLKRRYKKLPALAARLTADEIAALSLHSAVAYIEADQTLAAEPSSTSAEQTASWGVWHIHAAEAQARGITGANVKVAVLDTGVDYTHPELSPRYCGGYDFMYETSDPYDDSFDSHGTHVAGIIAASLDGNGMVGVAPGVSLYAVKVLDGAGFGDLSTILGGIDWAIANGMDVVNMSFGSPMALQILEDACNAAADAGIVLVAATGYRNIDPVSYPAAYASVIGVSATDSSDLITPFSPAGPGVAIVAPGMSILSTQSGGGYVTLSGTSQAAPHVAGVAALVLSAGIADANGDGRRSDEVRERLLTTARDLGAVGRDDLYGYGLTDVLSALVPPPPVKQNLGIYDRNFVGFSASDCLRCHDGAGGTTCPDPTTNCQEVSLRHHVMLDPSNPRYKPAYTCTSCHSPDPSTGNMSVTFNCVQCHVTTPHHKSAAAQTRHCAACHGSFVNNFDDGHYIPTYGRSIVTPDPICRVWADAAHTACAAGGCRTCHVASTAVIPAVASSSATHHGTGLGQGSNPPAQCGWCHSISTGSGGAATASFDIRTCESCHGPTSLHAIEYQYNTNEGTPGYGHIGANQDCWGCHGYFDMYDLPLSMGPTVPAIDTVQPVSVDSGVAAELVIAGLSLTNTVTMGDGSAKAYPPVVVLSLFDDAGREVASQAIVPTRFTESEIRAAVPATLRNGIWEVRVAKDYQGPLQKLSNKVPLVVKSRVAIDSACATAPTFTVTGKGFGPRPDPGFPGYGLFVDGERCTISSWSDVQIVGTCTVGRKEAAVIGINNLSTPVTAKIKNNCKG
jgi:subtilisin